MRSKGGETIEELTAFVQTMRDHAVKLDVNTDGAVDLCGTGGDHAGTFNISNSGDVCSSRGRRAGTEAWKQKYFK